MRRPAWAVLRPAGAARDGWKGSGHQLYFYGEIQGIGKSKGDGWCRAGGEKDRTREREADTEAKSPSRQGAQSSTPLKLQVFFLTCSFDSKNMRGTNSKVAGSTGQVRTSSSFAFLCRFRYCTWALCNQGNARSASLRPHEC